MESDDRFALRLRARLESGTGTARISFEWDAATVTSVVCRDFQVAESFSATVNARDYDVDGHFQVTPVDSSLVLDPSFRLPDSVLRPITLPSSISETVTISGHTLGVAASPAGLQLTSEWLWYGINVELAHQDEDTHTPS